MVCLMLFDGCIISDLHFVHDIFVGCFGMVLNFMVLAVSFLSCFTSCLTSHLAPRFS